MYSNVKLYIVLILIASVLSNIKSDDHEDEGCFCIQVYDPVCGVDGKTYGNACVAGCEKVAIACEGECPCPCEKNTDIKSTNQEVNDCLCTLIYAPVCGVDGEDYGSPCFAICARVKIACKGECPCEKNKDSVITNYGLSISK